MNSKMLGMLGLLAMGTAYAKADDAKTTAPVEHKKVVVAKAEDKKAAPVKEEKKAEVKAEEKSDAAAATDTADAGTPMKATGKKAAPKK
ncbi:MAG: hypothetical protein IPJ65_02985 [Archangiaceae bacterium]|nr:hypothetical protein [Archangiaceae bacterium]